MDLRVYAVVPAAGRGERFGGAKLLAKWRDRELLGHVLLKLGGARAAGLLVHTVVVHRPGDEAIRALAAEYRAYPVAMRNPEGGLSDSLRAGIEVIHAREAGQQAAALICLGDQPLLRIEVIHALIDGWRHGAARAIRPAYRDAPGEPGHPLLLDRSLWRYAGELRGDAGFAPLLGRHGIDIRTVPVAGSNPDVNTPEDLSALEPSGPPVVEDSTPSILDPFDA